MLGTSDTKDQHTKPKQSALYNLLSKQELQAFEKNIAELGEDNDYFQFPEKMDLESLPKKNLIVGSGSPKPESICSHADYSASRQLSLPRHGQITMLDIVNDRKTGQPTSSEVFHFYED